MEKFEDKQQGSCLEEIIDSSEICSDNFNEVLEKVTPDISKLVDGLEYDIEKYIGRGGIYSNVEILRALVDGHIPIYPFVKEHLNKASYDVTLGSFYWRTDIIGQDYYNYFDASDIDRYFEGPFQAIPVSEWAADKRRITPEGIPQDHPVIALSPGERVLAHTHEFIGIKPPGNTTMQARSTTGRNGIVVCKDAGYGDPGYFNRWTMEIQNDNDEDILIPVGYPVAQIVFYYTPEVAGSYTDSGSYAESTSLLETIENWDPRQMLPKAKPEQVRKPISVELPESKKLSPDELAEQMTKLFIAQAEAEGGRKYMGPTR